MSSSHPLSLRKTLLISLGIAFIPILLLGLSFYTHYKYDKATQEKLAELSARGFPITAQELNRQYHQHGFNRTGNAAPVYARAFKKLSYERLHFPDLNRRGSKPESVDSETLVKISEVLSENEAALTLLKEASTYPFLRYNIDFNEGYSLLLPHVVDHRNGARLLSIEAISAAASSDSSKAGEALIALFQNAIHLADEPILISLLTVIAIEDVGQMTLELVLAETELSPETIARLEQKLLILEQGRSMKNALQAELINGVQIYEQILSDAQFRSSILENTSLSIGIHFYQLSGLLAKDRFGFVNMLSEYISLTDRSPSEISKIGLPSEAPDFNPFKGQILRSIIQPSISRVFETDIRATTFLRATQIGLAAERFRLATGQFPEDLNDLVPEYLETLPIDPYSPDDRFDWIREDSVYSVRSQGTFESSGQMIPVEFRLRAR